MARELKSEHISFLEAEFGVGDIDELGDDAFHELFEKLYEIEAEECGGPDGTERGEIAAYIVDYMAEQFEDETQGVHEIGKENRSLMDKKYACPCCGEMTLDDQGEFDICDVCDWQDDPLQAENPDDDMGANWLSLNQYRAEWEQKRKADTI